jgi:hypothetical protein
MKSDGTGEICIGVHLGAVITAIGLLLAVTSPGVLGPATAVAGLILFGTCARTSTR